MKTSFCSLVLPIVAIAATTAFSAEPANVRISFVQPKRFSDFRIQGREENASAPIFRDSVSSYLSPYVSKRFPGCTLSLKFTDIDLAGRLITSNPRKLSNVRIDRDVASPLRLYFGYELTDSKGNILARGAESLVDPDYLYRYNYYSTQARTDTLFYEKATFYRWLSTVTPSEAKITSR
jgi:hypothetical protein